MDRVEQKEVQGRRLYPSSGLRPIKRSVNITRLIRRVILIIVYVQIWEFALPLAYQITGAGEGVIRLVP